MEAEKKVDGERMHLLLPLFFLHTQGRDDAYMDRKPVYLASEAEHAHGYMQGQRSFTCKYCGQEFPSMAKLAAHISWYHSSRRRRSREQEIIQLLREILQEIRSLRQDLKSLKIIEYTKRTEEKVKEVRSEKHLDKNLPSFIVGNPWVDILSRRSESD